MLLAGLAATGFAASACAPSQGERAHSQLRTLAQATRWQELYERGRAFAAVGDFTRAEEYFAAALESGGDSQKLIPLLLYCCMQDGRFLLGAQYAEEHLRKHPADYRTRFVLGSIYAGLGEVGPAERELKRVVATNPDEADARFALGKILWDSEKNFAEADRQFREYLRLAPTGAHAAEARDHLLHTVPLAASAELTASPTAETADASTNPLPQPLPGSASAAQ